MDNDLNDIHINDADNFDPNIENIIELNLKQVRNLPSFSNYINCLKKQFVKNKFNALHILASLKNKRS